MENLLYEPLGKKNMSTYNTEMAYSRTKIQMMLVQENRFRLFHFHIFQCKSNFMEFYSNRLKKVMNQGIFKIHWWRNYVGDINKMGNSSCVPRLLSSFIFSLLIDKQNGFVKTICFKSFCLFMRMLYLTPHGTRNGSLGVGGWKVPQEKLKLGLGLQHSKQSTGPVALTNEVWRYSFFSGILVHDTYI